MGSAGGALFCVFSEINPPIRRLNTLPLASVSSTSGKREDEETLVDKASNVFRTVKESIFGKKDGEDEDGKSKPQHLHLPS